MRGENKELLGEERSYHPQADPPDEPAADEVEFGDEIATQPEGADEVEFAGKDVAGDDVEFANEWGPAGVAKEGGEAGAGEGDRDVEAAQEVAQPVVEGTGTENEPRDEGRFITEEPAEEKGQGHGMGTISIILSVLAFFLVPFLLGPAGIILGVIAARRGSRLGWWAVGIGTVAVILTAFIAPIAGF